MAIFNCFPGGSVAPIDQVQNVYDDLGLSQTVERDGSEWTRSVSQDAGVEHSFSDFYGESVSTVMSMTSEVDPDADLNFSVSTAISFSQASTVAGGRVVSSGGGGGEGDTNNTFDITYHDGGPSAVKGQIIYIDSSDAEAKLAAYDGNAEVAGFLTEAVTSGDSTTIQTEGEISMSDWTDVIGTTNLTAGATYYLHTGGEMRVTPPASGSIVIVGRAITPTKFDVEINLPWE